MSGEINGTNCLLFRKTGASTKVVIVGQVELTHTITSAVIDISTKSSADFVSLMDGEASTKGRNISGSIIHSNDAEYIRMRESMLNGTIEAYILDFTGIEADQVSITGIPTALSDTNPMGDKVAMAFNILTTGADA